MADLKVSTGAPPAKHGRCSIYEGNNDAKGYSWLGAGRGMLGMSNLFLNQSLLFLAYEAAGCELGTVCETKVYGFYPSSWITNVPVIAGVVAALCLPVIGAIVDFTDYRRAVGIWSAIIIIAIQGAQVYTVADTWFIMCILQAFAVVFYFVQLVAIYAYLPDIAREVGERKMAKFTGSFQMVQFGCQALFLVVVAGITVSLNVETAQAETVLVGQISQGLNTFSTLILLGIGWFCYLEQVDAVRKLPEGHNMLLEGFKNNFKTMKSINAHFKKGIRWFFLALTFSQAAAQAVTSVSVVYLTDTLLLDTIETIIFFLATLLLTLVGCPIGTMLCQKTNPNTSYKCAMLYLFTSLAIGALALDSLPKYCAFIWGGSVGIGLGWLYSTEPLYFSMILPVGQEAEFSGFYNFASVIFSWLPPLIFTFATELGVPQKYALIMTVSFFLVAAFILMFTGTWEEIIEESKVVVENAVVPPKDGGDADEEKKKVDP